MHGDQATQPKVPASVHRLPESRGGDADAITAEFTFTLAALPETHRVG
jgi:hypothetical protein